MAVKIIYTVLTLVVYGYVYSTGIGGERGVLLYALIFGYIWKVWNNKTTIQNKLLNGFILWIIGSVLGVGLDIFLYEISGIVDIVLFIIFLFSSLFESEND